MVYFILFSVPFRIMQFYVAVSHRHKRIPNDPYIKVIYDILYIQSHASSIIYCRCAAPSRFCVCIHTVCAMWTCIVASCFPFFFVLSFSVFSFAFDVFRKCIYFNNRKRIIHLVGCGRYCCRHEKIAHSFYFLSLWLLLLLAISFLPDINVLLTANFAFLLYRFIIKFHESAVCALHSVYDDYNQTRTFFSLS